MISSSYLLFDGLWLSLVFIRHRAFALDRLHVSKTFLQLQTIHDTHISVVIDCICKCLHTSCMTFKLHHSTLGWPYVGVTVNMLTQTNCADVCVVSLSICWHRSVSLLGLVKKLLWRHICFVICFSVVPHEHYFFY